MNATCLIVDDEKAARDGLKLLCESVSKLEIVGVCKNGIEAIEQIHALRPQLLLLDIQMPGINGFEVLRNLTGTLPQVIFITAHDEYAIQAFEIHAVDYLLKPFSDERFYTAIARALDQVKNQQPTPLKNILKIDENIDTGENLTIKVNGNIHRLALQKIKFIEAYDYYVKIHLTDDMHIVRETMKNMEHKLTDDHFLRVHKSYIVNKTYVKSLNRMESGAYILITKDDHQVKISRGMVHKVKAWIQ